MSFLALLGALQQPKPKPVRRREIFDLSVARINHVYYMAGDNLSVEALTAGAVVQLRFDQPDATLITLVAGHGFPLQPFNRLYLTNAIQAGFTLTIEFDYYGFNSEEQASESLQALNDLISDTKLNTLRLLDAGTLIERDGFMINGTLALYTVPANQTLYMLYFDLNICQVAPGLMEGSINYLDLALVLHDFAYLRGMATGRLDAMHTQNAFNIFALPAGYVISIWASVAATTRTDGAFTGVLI